MNEKQILAMCEAGRQLALSAANSGFERTMLQACTFEVNHDLTSTAGKAFWVRSAFGTPRIEISGPIFAQSHFAAQLIETILHELAHIMTPGEGHGPAWVAAAHRIGCGAERCHSMPRARKPQGLSLNDLGL